MTFGEAIGSFFGDLGVTILLLLGIGLIIKLIECWGTFGHRED